jgi:hypothetical protein
MESLMALMEGAEVLSGQLDIANCQKLANANRSSLFLRSEKTMTFKNGRNVSNRR